MEVTVAAALTEIYLPMLLGALAFSMVAVGLAFGRMK